MCVPIHSTIGRTGRDSERVDITSTRIVYRLVPDRRDEDAAQTPSARNAFRWRPCLGETLRSATRNVSSRAMRAPCRPTDLHERERTERRYLYLAMEAIGVGTRRRHAGKAFTHFHVGIQPLVARNILSRPGENGLVWRVNH